ncbi:MAG: hypothetical protein HY706_16060 [Candidatus Hydrogenedentes bacterium]|nr:hypothetical protein [Candidatus Hydrogenedentota bacterium]
MGDHSRRDLTHDLLLPTLLFAALGGMTWAVRGSSGFGASAGCIFAGVTLGTAWWFIARHPSAKQSRPYASGWIILAMTAAFGIAGNQGWMQWPHFFNEHLYTDYRNGEFVPISRAYGFIWLFLAGIPWGGMGACFLAWCGSARRTSPLQWVIRLGSGFGVAYVLGVLIYNRFPDVFLPLHDSLRDQYQNLEAHPNLKKLVRDNQEAMMHMGLYLGFLGYEIARREWKNVTLVVTVGLLNGIGWSLLQNWMWANRLWPDARFNFWRCWETSGGISIGVAYGIAYYLVNRRSSNEQIAAEESRTPAGPPGLSWLGAYLVSVVLLGSIVPEVMPVWGAVAYTLVAAGFGIGYYLTAQKEFRVTGPLWSVHGPVFERWGAYAGLILGLGLSIKNGLRGWANIYHQGAAEWDAALWPYMGPLLFIALTFAALWVLLRPFPRSAEDDPIPHAYGLLWLVLIVQNVIAQLVTGPPTNWSEVAFNIYYVLLFLISAVIVQHYQFVKTLGSSAAKNPMQ